MKCTRCRGLAEVALPSHHAGFCRECFFVFFRNQVSRAIEKHGLLSMEDRVLVALSGGKDSLALAWQLRDLGYDVTGLHLDLAIPGSSTQARELAERFCREQGIALHVVETAREGLPILQVKERIRRPICSACGSIKRYYFNRFAIEGGYTALATGHNLNDEVARLFSNVLSWDEDYLGGQGPLLEPRDGFVRKVKPLFRVTEFETAAFCFLRAVEYASIPCPFSKGATFTFYKTLWDALESEQPGRRISFYEQFLKRGRPAFAASSSTRRAALTRCLACGYPTSQETCSVCRLREQLAQEPDPL
jgi:tRNA-5-methyluridine54 2-sulfurtransferase